MARDWSSDVCSSDLVADKEFSAGEGDAPAEPDLTLTMGSAVGTGMFTGEVDATSAYMAGYLKISGPLPEAIKFRTIIELVREALDDM
jgi:putative sterol carrier protein